MRYVRFPKRQLWHVVGRTYGADTLTVCDRKIPAAARWLDDGTLDSGDVCWNCFTGQDWRHHSRRAVDRMTLREYVAWYQAIHPPKPTPPALPLPTPLHAHKTRCRHDWQDSLFDPWSHQCARCGAFEKWTA